MSKPARAGAPDEIEITDAMVSAGTAVLGDYDLSRTALSLLAEEVFRAMHRARALSLQDLIDRADNRVPSSSK
jgi:hypothetical protein